MKKVSLSDCIKNNKYTLILLIATLFVSVGYASVNSIILDINGIAEAKKEDGLFITQVVYNDSVDADVEASNIKNIIKTTLNSDIVLSNTNNLSLITYKVTIYNSTDITYYFNEAKYLEDNTTYSNLNIVFDLDGLKKDDAIESKSSITFSITFHYKNNLLVEDNTLSSYINFVFKKKNMVSYVNIDATLLPNEILDGNTFTIDLTGKASNKIKVYIDNVLTTDYTYIDNILNISSVSGDIKIVGVVAEPAIVNSNLVPIYYDNNTWKVADTTTDWYDYGSQKWANAAVLNDGVTLNVNDSVDIDNDVRAMFVWIPRYEYKISDDGSNEIYINFITKDDTSTKSDYILHPAFVFGDADLDGIWVGKFETSTTPDSTCYISPSISSCGGIIELYIKPNRKSLREQTVSTQFSNALEFKRFLTSSSITSHMLKNSEWAAVSYLSQSKYGKYGNNNYSSNNREIYVNNSSDLITGKSSGSYINQDKIFDYNYGFDNDKIISEENGVGASTTGNITGIYDMNGGAYEYVMAYYSGASSTFGSAVDYNHAGFTGAIDSKYYDNYTSLDPLTACSGTSCLGHALNETKGYYNDAASFVDVYNPWLMRGGVFDGGTSSGIFAYTGINGYSGSYATFRIALVNE